MPNTPQSSSNGNCRGSSTNTSASTALRHGTRPGDSHGTSSAGNQVASVGEQVVSCDLDLNPIAESSHEHAHHIHEFGEVDRIVHVAQSESSAAEEDQPVLPISVKGQLARSERWGRLYRRCYRPRHLMQYFYNETLYRTIQTRKVTTEELFLDLVIVAAIAALGHELRESGITWASVEKFMLLFSAVISSWRQAVLLWNFWGIHHDLAEKAGIYLTFLALTGIALGAHSAFDDAARPYVAVSSFCASAIPLSALIRWSLKERLLKNPANRVNEVLLTACFEVFYILPYLAAAFVKTERATRALYWTSVVLQFMFMLIPACVFKWLHRNIPTHTRIAVNIELFVEKHEVLTMIVMGETMIGLLFEAGAALTIKGVRVGLMYLSAVAGTATLYALQTLYVQVDSPIQKGGKHALRHNTFAGYAWGMLHAPYHFFLILFATGLSISLRDVAIAPKPTAVQVATRASSNAAAGAAQFTRSARWIFAVGWGGSVICSALMGALHRPGPRAATKHHRIVIRCIIAVAVMVGIPFSTLSAGWFQGVIAMVSVAVSVTEFLFVQMDRIGFFRSEASGGAFTSTESGGAKDPERVDFDTDSFSSDLDSDEDIEAPRSPDDVVLNVDTGCGGSPTAEYLCALKERLCKGHCKRLVPVKPTRSQQESG